MDRDEIIDIPTHYYFEWLASLVDSDDKWERELVKDFIRDCWDYRQELVCPQDCVGGMAMDIVEENSDKFEKWYYEERIM